MTILSWLVASLDNGSVFTTERNERMLYSEWNKTGEEVAMAYYTMLLQNLPSGTEKNNKQKPWSGLLVLWQRLEAGPP
jgi:hypothetical protein